MPYTVKRENLENIIFVISVLSICTLVILLVPKNSGRLYDCSIAEFSPDFPIEVREQCRKLRAENILQKPK